MYFVVGYVWVLSISSILALIGIGEYKIVLPINLMLQSSYLITFLRVYKLKKREIIIPALALVTIQVFTFLTVLFVVISNDWAVKPMLYVLIVFFITLFIQVIEQIRYLKRLEKP